MLVNASPLPEQFRQLRSGDIALVDDELVGEDLNANRGRWRVGFGQCIVFVFFIAESYCRAQMSDDYESDKDSSNIFAGTAGGRSDAMLGPDG